VLKASNGFAGGLGPLILLSSVAASFHMSARYEDPATGPVITML